MAEVKIYLDPHETEEDAHDLLRKALEHHEGGGEHQETFHQPAARDVCNQMVVEHDRMWARMLREISAVIDEEVG